MAKSVYIKTGLTGGSATTDLDGVDGNKLVDGDVAFVYTGGKKYEYLLNATGGAAESSPNVIVPDTNPGTKNWELQSIVSASLVETENTDIDTGTETVDSFADTLGLMAVWYYVLTNSSHANMRAGTIVSCWATAATSTPVYTENATDDIGSTLGVASFAVDKSGNTVRLRCTTTSDNWACYVTRRLVG